MTQSAVHTYQESAHSPSIVPTIAARNAAFERLLLEACKSLCQVEAVEVITVSPGTSPIAGGQPGPLRQSQRSKKQPNAPVRETCAALRYSR